MLEIVHGAFFNDYKAALLFLRRLEKITLLNKEQIGCSYFCILMNRFIKAADTRVSYCNLT